MKHLKKLMHAGCLILFGIVLGIVIMVELSQRYFDQEEVKTKKYLDLYKMLVKWLYLKQQGYQLGDYLEKQGYHKIAIYGMHYTGERLYDELKQSNVKVMYAIDRNASAITSPIQVKLPTDFLDQVDAVIVTTISDYQEIKEALEKRAASPFASLKTLIEAWERSVS